MAKRQLCDRCAERWVRAGLCRRCTRELEETSVLPPDVPRRIVRASADGPRPTVRVPDPVREVRTVVVEGVEFEIVWP